MLKYRLPLNWKVLVVLSAIPFTLTVTYDVFAATEGVSTIAFPDISTFRDISIAGFFGFFLYAYFNERKAQNKKDELITLQLREIVEKNAVAMTLLAESINNFQRNCIEIQNEFRNEVERMKDKNDVS